MDSRFRGKDKLGRVACLFSWQRRNGLIKMFIHASVMERRSKGQHYFQVGPFHCHPEQSEGSKILAIRAVLLTKNFRFLAALGTTSSENEKALHFQEE